MLIQEKEVIKTSIRQGNKKYIPLKMNLDNNKKSREEKEKVWILKVLQTMHTKIIFLKLKEF